MRSLIPGSGEHPPFPALLEDGCLMPEPRDPGAYPGKPGGQPSAISGTQAAPDDLVGDRQLLARHAGGPGGDVLPGPLTLLLRTAQREIDWHVSEHDMCAACGSAFPRQRARLADLALAGL
jgi:hypothetical protein